MSNVSFCRILFAAGAVIALLAPGAGATEPQDQEPAAATETAAAQELRVVVDPETGKIISMAPGQPGSGLVMDQVVLRMMDTEVDDLVVEAGPRGSKKVDLKGRFFSPLVAVVGADGQLRMDHATLATPQAAATEPAETTSETTSEQAEETRDDR